VIVIGCYGGECLLAATAATTIGASKGRNPPGAVLPTNVDHQIRLHLAVMGTAGTIPDYRVRCGVGLEHMLLETTLVHELLAAFADVLVDPGVLLHVIVHCVLSRLNNSAFRTDEVSICVLEICQFCSRRHPAWRAVGLTRHQVYHLQLCCR